MRKVEIYHDKEWLIEQYNKTKSIYKMANMAGCHPRTIHKWMCKHKIPMYGMKWLNHSEETKKKIGSRVLEVNPTRMNGKKHSARTRTKMSLSRRGSKNGNWKGGVTKEIRKFRRSKEYIAWRKAVIERSGGICEECHSDENIEAHHIISLHKDFSKALDIDNGMALCRSCHKKRQEGQ